MSVGQSKTSVANKSAMQIARTLEERIRSGKLAVGARMPTVRESAQKLKVDKNTVARAYKALERKGYLELTRGRGAFVVRREPLHGDFDNRWLQRVEQLLKDARSHALGREAVLQSLTELVERVYGHAEMRIAFIECNQPDIQILGGVIRNAIERSLAGILLDEFCLKPSEIAQRFDLLVTTFNHLSEVNKLLSGDAKDKVVGMHSLVTHNTLLKIARLHATVIGFVYELPRVGDEYGHAIHAYHPNATVMPVSINDKPRLQALLKKADAIVVTQMCQERLLALKPKQPVILLATTIDQQSLDYLRSKIAEQETGKQGNKETAKREVGKQGNRETRKQGDREAGKQADSETRK